MRIKSRGFTLIEVIVTVAIVAIGISLAAQMMIFSMNGQKSAEKEFDFQSQMRLTSQTLNSEIRKATVLFAIPQKTFETKKPEWNYIGLADKNTLVSYIWNKDKNTHDERILIKSEDDKSFNLFFKKNAVNSNMLEFNLQGFLNDAPESRMSIRTELEAMNSLVVEDGGTEGYPATAIAYRTEDTPQPKTKEGAKVAMAISLVLDRSGSMKDKMDGKEKMDILNDEVKKLIEKFKVMAVDNDMDIYISIIPYSNHANPDKSGSHDMKIANERTYTNLNDGGGTNTGDGLRRGYYSLKYLNDNKSTFKLTDKKIVSSIILLTDGDPTKYSYTGSDASKEFYLGTENVKYKNTDSKAKPEHIKYNNSNEPIDVKKYTEPNNSMDYVKEISKNLIANSSFHIDSYLIGFGVGSDQINRLKKINTILTKAGYKENPVFEPKGEIELNEALDEISKTILDKVWHIYGPY